MSESDTPQYEIHPYANIFPLPHPESTEYLDLAASLRDNTMLVPITLYQGKILDGRTRYRAYKEHPNEIQLRTQEFEGSEEEALNYSLAMNNDRRHMNESQRALSAMRFAALLPGKIKDNHVKAAGLFRVSVKSIHRISAVNNQIPKNAGAQVILDAVEQGDLDVVTANNIVLELPAEKWKEAMNDDGRMAKKLISQAKRQNLERKLMNSTNKAANTLLAEGQQAIYNVIYIDPPWRFETYSDAGKEKGAENHYPTMQLDDIRQLKIPAADNCAMFLWTTTPHLHNAIEIMQGWGFDYKSCYVWHKHGIGTGYWTRNQAEFLLLGIKGEIPAPTPDLQMPQVLATPKLKHSEKPEIFAEGITKMFPSVPKLEMFARARNHKGDNWHYWGNEVETTTEEAKPKIKRAEPSKPKKRITKPPPGAIQPAND